MSSKLAFLLALLTLNCTALSADDPAHDWWALFGATPGDLPKMLKKDAENLSPPGKGLNFWRKTLESEEYDRLVRSFWGREMKRYTFKWVVFMEGYAEADIVPYIIESSLCGELTDGRLLLVVKPMAESWWGTIVPQERWHGDPRLRLLSAELPNLKTNGLSRETGFDGGRMHYEAVSVLALTGTNKVRGLFLFKDLGEDEARQNDPELRAILRFQHAVLRIDEKEFRPFRIDPSPK